jgi:hypothetical protein
LGLGRAPGTDPVTVRALRRDLNAADTFLRDVIELQAFSSERSAVDAVTGLCAVMCGDDGRPSNGCGTGNGKKN